MHLRILKIIATSGFLTALECTKFQTDVHTQIAFWPAYMKALPTELTSDCFRQVSDLARPSWEERGKRVT